jgi:hypothetical protein
LHGKPLQAPTLSPVCLGHGLAGFANVDFAFVIVSQEKTANAMGFSVE